MPISKEELLNEYQDLVWLFVRKFSFHSEADREDAFQAGCIGLCEAYNRFEESKGCEFTTYAYEWVHKFVREFAQKNAFFVKVPSHQMALSHKVHKAFIQLREDGLDRLDAIKKAAKVIGVTQLEAEEALAVYQSHKEHNAYLDDPDDSTNLKNEVDIFEVVAINHQVEKIKKKLHLLSNRERDIIDLMYLGKEVSCETISDAGRIMNVSKQSAQEFHKKAIKKLRAA